MCEFMPKAMQTHNTSRCSTAYLNNKIGIVSINDRSAILWILFIFFSRYNGHNTSIVHLAWRFVIEIYFWFWEWNVIIITYISMAHFHAMIRSSSAVQRQPLHFWGFFFFCVHVGCLWTDQTLSYHSFCVNETVKLWLSCVGHSVSTHSVY